MDSQPHQYSDLAHDPAADAKADKLGNAESKIGATTRSAVLAAKTATWASERRMHALVRRFCTGILSIEHGPLYSYNKPKLTDCVLDSDGYRRLFDCSKGSFPKLLRLTSIGLLKHLASKPGEFLHGINLKMEAFHQLVLSAQRQTPVSPETTPSPLHLALVERMSLC